MRYQPISKEFYQKTRIKFSKNMKPNTMAVFFSNEEPYRTADTYYSYRQQSDLFYLTGIDQEKTILVLFPDAHEEKYREILFVRKTSKEIAIREGNKLTIDQVKNQSGIQTVMYLETFDRIFHFLTNFCSGIYCNLNENMRALPTWDLNRKMVDELKNKYPLHQFYRSGPLLKKLRMVKSSEEVSMIQKACNITGKAFDRILRSVEPGMMEYQIEAEMTHEFLWNGSSGHAYTPIVASGYNACVLHYVENNNQCNDGDLLLMDFGSEYGNYASDCSRTIPVNGKFSKRQATIYNTVLYVQKAAMNLLVPGKTITQYHQEVGEVMTEALLKIDLLTKEDVENQSESNPAYKKYFMHGTSHHLGIDVHDHGDFYTPIIPGMVFTVEPGIYIPEENLGVRLEDNILITDNGYHNFMKDFPIEIEEIETVMNS